MVLDIHAGDCDYTLSRTLSETFVRINDITFKKVMIKLLSWKSYITDKALAKKRVWETEYSE